MEPQSSADLSAEAQAATNAATALGARRSGIGAEIAAVKQTITDARLAAARAGDPIGEAAPAEKAALAELLEERDTLPERHHVARENAVLLAIRAEGALIFEVSSQIAQARTDLQPLVVAAEAAEAARAAQAAHLAQLEGIASTAAERRRRSGALLETIRHEGVRAL
ncbi:MAG: hypothetical protein M3426_08365 [Actinomycetota bacterium]|nr:hypothetical protein [Actinomycetota bacterium]